jgi:tetratricopeptide (TPR) repeat protein
MELERVGHRLDRPDLVARALVGQAQLILEAMGGSETPECTGVPHFMRTGAHAADRWLRAADALRGQGDFPGAVGLLEQALQQLPAEPGLVHARLTLAEISGDTATAAALARRQLDHGASGPLASVHWLRIAEVAAEQGNAVDALDAVTQAVRASPDSLPARGLELDMLSAGADSGALAVAIERTGDQMSTDDGRARWQVLAAEEWARGAGDIAQAKASLAKVAMLGAAAALPDRVGRFLSVLCQSPEWYDEATRRLASTVTLDSEKRDLWFELLQSRILDRNPAEAARLLGSLVSTPGGLKLGRTLAAYALPLIESSDSLEADERDPHMAREVALQALADRDEPFIWASCSAPSTRAENSERCRCSIACSWKIPPPAWSPVRSPGCVVLQGTPPEPPKLSWLAPPPIQTPTSRQHWPWKPVSSGGKATVGPTPSKPSHSPAARPPRAPQPYSAGRFGPQIQTACGGADRRWRRRRSPQTAPG